MTLELLDDQGDRMLLIKGFQEYTFKLTKTSTTITITNNGVRGTPINKPEERKPPCPA